ncbi:hypothetical protein BN7_6245 [Wickerhamomyces ciferrii]|uniref:Schlafen group 3-like DNA/RNA helicase domain-containing protein n=1 Tax=Wickerhamomyces ciferrii (strain ATCC 14091 / BCRC 22168 / CBS 111 / JCM 3599 / NBRC 0793 / NRRL Y-1031 F-60-10) TaxID=1206466 RepID=K0KN05_WICCF|nr:uncharacterized protein BN7_6245 [Wickerhamomyces ciferrii]CCH46650.1 hypothetical protein BN7_6245 [Wickerhamomyces ciferrii]
MTTDNQFTTVKKRTSNFSNSTSKTKKSYNQPGRSNYKSRNNEPFVPSAAVKKISQIELSDEQIFLKSKILNFINTGLENYESKPSVFIINGDAGTGKSVILNSLFNEIQKISRTEKGKTLSNTKNTLVVNHPEMLKLYHQISKQFPYISKSDLERPTSLINNFNKSPKQEKVDVLIIDEAHLLATAKDAFKRFNQENHLEELIKISKVIIIVFDDKQSLRMGSYWTLDHDLKKGKSDGASLTSFLNNSNLAQFETFNLTKQFRITAKPDLINWTTEISTTKKILPLPLSDAESKTFDFKIFENCQKMYDSIKEKNAEFGQSRILATYDFPYRLDGKDYFVSSDSDEFKLRWDRYLPQLTTPWSERDDTIDEVGSVYTIQGFDLNYAGIILGRSIGYDASTDSLKIKPEFHDDNAGFTKKKNINNVDKVKEKIILNSLNVLLTRGVKGLYIFPWDKELREKLLRNADDRVVSRN